MSQCNRKEFLSMPESYRSFFVQGFETQLKGTTVLNAILNKDADFIKRESALAHKKASIFGLDEQESLKKTALGQAQFLDRETSVDHQQAHFSKRANDLLFSNLETRLQNDAKILESKSKNRLFEQEQMNEQVQKMIPTQNTADLIHLLNLESENEKRKAVQHKLREQQEKQKESVVQAEDKHNDQSEKLDKKPNIQPSQPVQSQPQQTTPDINDDGDIDF